MSFDRLAPHYRWMEAVLAGGRLQRARTAWLPELPPARRILLAGEGPGRFLDAVLDAFPTAEIVCLDASAAMLDQARAKVRRSHPAARVEFRHARLPDEPVAGAAFDLLATHFFLDCFPPEQLERVVHRLAGAAAPGAHWLVADFHEPSRGLARWRARGLLAVMYAFFRRVTALPARRLTPPDPCLAAHGFRLAGRRLSEWGLIHSDLWKRPPA